MIVLDTNVLSAVMAERADAAVAAWLDRYPPDGLCLTAITILEVRHGLGRLPAGRRRTLLERRFGDLRGLLGGVLPFDDVAAEEAGRLMAVRRSRGITVGLMDMQIAGICRAQGHALATRNTRDFADCGIPLLDPWAD
ncbi:type II toxin-antitoxin system VapC family toxin [Rhodospirillum centenum]|uniref:Ribonuclease VapC n=1 Tax=Rhodospirillum centenum (strain ATCC 51521 / SW) TaxID=414684 RepID=B6IP13_RHOCS|nr:type II toxin-antitoxin system VapC family toxin [Rhodospirillum centenum]ACI99433.1 PIN (PilT N terminus) domain proteni [Rhodospirillum centenum SW]